MVFNPSETLGSLIGSSSRMLGCRLNRNFAEAGFEVTVEQWKILVFLWHQDGQTQQELADKTGKDKTSITRLLDNLEKRNFIERLPGHTDRRSKLIYLTPTGKHFRQDLEKIVEKTLQDVLQGISNKDLEITRQVLRQIITNTNIC